MSSNVASLVERIQSIASNASHDITQDQEARATLLQASRELTATLEQPDEVISLVAFSGGRNMCVRLAIDLQLFEILAGASEPLTADQLASECNAEKGLVSRIVRTLAGMGFASQVKAVEGEAAFVPTAVTKHMTMPSAQAGIKFL